MLLNQLEQFLTEGKLHQLHRRFGHPSVNCLATVLEHAGKEVNSKALKALTKYCYHCQLHIAPSAQFKFTLQHNVEFNSIVIINVLYLAGKPVLQVVDAATSFQAARFLSDMTATTAWSTIKECWIDTYQGPPDLIITDSGSNFTGTDFKQHANLLTIEV